MLLSDPSSGKVTSGMSLTTGASFTGLTVNVALPLSDRRSGSVAVKVIVSAPYQSAGAVIVATLSALILTIRLTFPE